jgi:hypothetical protein
MKLVTKLVAPFALVLSFAWLNSSTVAHADEHHGEHHEGHEGHEAHEGHEGHDGHEGHEGHEAHEARGGQEWHERQMAPRPAPPRFQPHPPGAHPHGPMVRQHALRVLRPTVVRRGERPWRHWEHPEFARPIYYWDWNLTHTVTCTAEDSYGDQYPVTEQTFAGFGLANMGYVEDDALDRCYQESGGDQSCYLATCSHY